MARWAPGFDIAFSRVSRSWCRARYNEGYRVAVQNLWTGGYQNNPRICEVAAANLSDFLEEGFLIAGYANANPWYPAAQCVEEMILNAGHIWDSLRIMAEDVEIPGVTEARIFNLCRELETRDKRVPFYTAAWFFKEILGNPQWPWLKEHKIWEAYYDGDPDVDFLSRRFGPWELADVVGEQYLGTTIIDGVDVDLNVFDLDYWEGEKEMLSAEDERQVRDIVQEETKALSATVLALSQQNHWLHLAFQEFRAYARDLAEQPLDNDEAHICLDERKPIWTPEP